MDFLNLIFTEERQRNLASQNQGDSQEHLSVEDQVARAINRILAKPQVDVQHHKYLVESSQLELKLERLRLNDRLYNLGNKSFKTTSDKFSKGLSYKHKNVRRLKNTLKDFEVSSRTESLVHRHSAPKSKKNCLNPSLVTSIS